MHTLFDFHSHILPKMDDGSRDADMSIKMLSSLSSQGIGGVFCTPHFLPMNESTSEFIRRRTAAYNALCAYIKSSGISNLPAIRVGCEIRVCRGISERDLSGLEYEGTQALLLELPREELTAQIVKEIYSLCRSKRYIPVIAHLDRYKWFKKRDIEALSEIPDVVFQFNAEALSEHKGRGTALKLAKNGHRVLFGSDSHNISDRSPNFYLLTGEGGRARLSKKERDLLLECHRESEDFVFGSKEQASSEILFF